MEENILSENIEQKNYVEQKEFSGNSSEQENLTDVSKQVDEQSQCENSENLILGKFKSVDDLSKAYQELEKYKGLQSQEIGKLRQNENLLSDIRQAWTHEEEIRRSEKELKDIAEKYNTPEYFQDSNFREMYKHAYLALGKNLDTDKFINLIENYVSSRIYMNENLKSKQNETQQVISGMKFEKNPQNSIMPPKKRLDEMSEKEVNELLAKVL